MSIANDEASTRLIWITPKAEQLIAYCARVSSNNQDNPNIAGLIKYLIKSGHWSPFEMCSMTVEIVTTRAIAPQILRHRSFSFQEFSQRYQTVSAIALPQLRSEHKQNRQSSEDVHPRNDQYQVEIKSLFDQSMALYERMTSDGVARETARMILPLSTKTKIYMNGTIRSWIHYLTMRCDEHTQLEHRMLANQIRAIFVEHFPVVAEALGWTATNLVSNQ